MDALCHSDCKQWKGDTSNIKAAKNAPFDFGGLSRVEKAVHRCVGGHRDLPKWHRTYRDRFSSFSWYSNIKAAELENAPVDFGGLSRVERAVNRCVSGHRDLPKWCRTYRDRFYPFSWYLQHKGC